MNCQDFQTHLAPFVDGELGVNETAAAGAHLADCPRCQTLAEQERQFRQLLRRQPREAAPPEFRARVTALCRREARRKALRPWLVAPALAAAAALAVALLQPGLGRPGPLVGELVANHVAYADIERPAEFTSADRRKVAEWFRERAALRATVPDLSGAGIRLVGGRIGQIRERRAAFVLYEKGRTLLSIFMVPTLGGGAALPGTPVSYRSHQYVTQEQKGYRTVAWTEGDTLFGLVSLLDYQALLECADALRFERARESRV